MAQKFLLLDTSSETNEKSGDTYNMLKVFGEVSKFGKTTKEAIAIRVDSVQELEKYRQFIGKEIELNIVLPHSDYTYNLSK